MKSGSSPRICPYTLYGHTVFYATHVPQALPPMMIEKPKLKPLYSGGFDEGILRRATSSHGFHVASFPFQLNWHRLLFAFSFAHCLSTLLSAPNNESNGFRDANDLHSVASGKKNGPGKAGPLSPSRAPCRDPGVSLRPPPASQALVRPGHHHGKRGCPRLRTVLALAVDINLFGGFPKLGVPFWGSQ